MCHEVALEFFATNAPDPPHWTLNSCFGEFRTIWVHSVPFDCLTKLGAKRAELVQKFVPRSRVGIFCNEAPNPPHWMLNRHFGAFRTIRVHLGPLVELRNSVQNGPNKCKSSCHEVASECFATNAPDPPPLNPKLTFWCVSYYSGAFGTVGCFTELGAKSAE